MPVPLSTDRVVIVGCGGHGRELYATIGAVNEVRPTWDVVGFVDDRPEHLDRLDRLGARVLGSIDWLEQHPGRYALGIGSAAVREQLTDRLAAAGCEPITIVHPGARIGPDVVIGEGAVIYDRTTVTTNVRLGRHAHLNVACAVQHDSTVGDFVQMSPGVLVNGDCRLGDRVFLGSGAIVTRGCEVGADARIGAGAVVLRDVPSGATAIGVPASVRPDRPSHSG